MMKWSEFAAKMETAQTGAVAASGATATYVNNGDTQIKPQPRQPSLGPNVAKSLANFDRIKTGLTAIYRVLETEKQDIEDGRFLQALPKVKPNFDADMKQAADYLNQTINAVGRAHATLYGWRNG